MPNPYETNGNHRDCFLETPPVWLMGSLQTDRNGVCLLSYFRIDYSVDFAERDIFLKGDPAAVFIFG
jgi:hypothetical protein